MEKRDIFEAVMQSEPEDVKELAKLISHRYSPETTRKPEPGLVMFRAEESVEHRSFNVGEILVTMAEVRISDTLGYAMVLGSDKDRALNCAVLMAAVEAELPEKTDVETLASQLRERNEKKLREERKIVSSTRVDFETMSGQDPNIVNNQNQSEGVENG
jgi:alpha-D-ribose 1-methylphosphonate 5-triphosphate synthase subunit PhnG